MDTQKQSIRAGTHSGRFHADEVMATAVLQEIFDVELVRTREQTVLDTLDIVYDVGGGEFDHHSIEKKYRETGTPYAACGLIWDRFGREVIREREPSLCPEELESVFEYIDAVLMEGIDASDNGLRTYETIIPTVTISAVIAGFNPTWDSEASEDTAFHDAVRVASDVFKNTLDQELAAVRAKGYVIEAYNNRIRPEILLLERSYPWSRALHEIDTENEVKFVIYPRGNDYLIQTVRRGDGSRRNRKSLPSSWAGKRDEELGEILGIDDAVFCHPSRFIAGAGSFESIMKMADIAVNEPEGQAVNGFLQALRRLLSRR